MASADRVESSDPRKSSKVGKHFREIVLYYNTVIDSFLRTVAAEFLMDISTTYC